MIKGISSINSLFKLALLGIFILGLNLTSNSQYAPAALKPGSTAISMDSNIFIDWATKCEIKRGWRNISHKDSGYTSIGDSISATGKAGENGVISLGDSGIAICQFSKPIVNGKGWDFAVFENTFDDRFLELAFVEVSSDGWRYFRFPSHSLSDTSTQTGAFGITEPENINNLAGKYRYGFGVPFDIDELPDYKDLNKQSITHIKIIDVVGSLLSPFAGYDTAGRKVNDPWPTPWPSGGFDLDAIGVIHQLSLSISPSSSKIIRIKGPNPIKEGQKIIITEPLEGQNIITIQNAIGHVTKSMQLDAKSVEIDASELPTGIFIVSLKSEFGNYFYRGLKL